MGGGAAPAGEKESAASLEKNPRNLRLEFAKFQNSDPLCSVEFLAREKHDPSFSRGHRKGETNSPVRNWLEFLKFPRPAQRRDPCWFLLPPFSFFLFFFTACTFVRTALTKKLLSQLFRESFSANASFSRFLFLFLILRPGSMLRPEGKAQHRGRRFVRVSSDWFKLAARIIATLAAARCC